MNATTVKAVASLAPVAGLIYTVSHFGTVTTIALGLTVGAAVWVRAKAKGSPAAAPEQPAAAGPSAAEQIVAGWTPPALHAATVNPADVQHVITRLRKTV